jgi:transposase
MIPSVKVSERQGRRPVADRVCFEAIVFVMITGIAWGHLPSELGCSGVTAWRRLRDWQLAGVWERLRAALLEAQRGRGDRLVRGGCRRQPYSCSSRGP